MELGVSMELFLSECESKYCIFKIKAAGLPHQLSIINSFIPVEQF